VEVIPSEAKKWKKDELVTKLHFCVASDRWDLVDQIADELGKDRGDAIEFNEVVERIAGKGAAKDLLEVEETESLAEQTEGMAPSDEFEPGTGKRRARSK
jgi:hypothetical protein